MTVQDAIEHCRKMKRTDSGNYHVLFDRDEQAVQALLAELDRRAELYREARKSLRVRGVESDRKYAADTERKLAGE